MICDKYRGKRDTRDGFDDRLATRKEKWQKEAIPWGPQEIWWPWLHRPGKTKGNRAKKSKGSEEIPSRTFHLALICRCCDPQINCKWGYMKKKRSNPGIRLLLKRYRAIFRREENQKYYSKQDFREAERKFLKYALEQRKIETQDELFK